MTAESTPKPTRRRRPAVKAPSFLGTTARRVLSSIVALTVFLYSIFFLPGVFALLVLLIMIGGTLEMIHISERARVSLGLYGKLASLIVCGLIWIASTAYFEPILMIWIAAFAITLSTVISLLQPRIIQYNARAASNVFTSLYISVPLGMLLYLYFYFTPTPGQSMLGARLLLFLLVPIWVSDSAAYFVGRRWGQNKLAPSVSPSKTVEGFIGGMIGAVVAAFAYRYFLLAELPPEMISYGTTVLLGAMIGFFGALGDLVESAMKRDARIKDSGKFMPGHGGILDRIDSVIFSGVYFFMIIYYRVPATLGHEIYNVLEGGS